MTNELAVREVGMIRSIDDVARVGKAMAESGYFQDAKDAAKAAVKILAGQEMGFGPFASMTGIHVIKGKPSIGANLMASAVKAHPKYDYRVKRIDNDVCVIMFYQGGEELGESSFTRQDAQAAGTQNLGKFPRNMLFARAMSNGIKWFCPDVFVGNTVYTPDELGQDDATLTQQQPPIVDVTPREVTAPPVVEAEEQPDLWDAEPVEEAPPFEVSPEIRAKAISWGMSKGVFNHEKHASSAFDKLMRESEPKSKDEASKLWKDDVGRREREADAQPAPADDLAAFLASNPSPQQLKDRAGETWKRLQSAGLAMNPIEGFRDDNIPEWLVTAETALDGASA